MKIPKIKIPGLEDIKQMKERLVANFDFFADRLRNRFDEIDKETEKKRKKILEERRK